MSEPWTPGGRFQNENAWVEAFNATNTPHFDGPNTQLGNPNFGRISSAGHPRNLQFGLKLIF